MFETGDIVFVMTHGNAISELFSKVMGSKWSHSALVYGELDNEKILLETNDYCVNLDYLQRYLDDPTRSVMVLRRPKPLSDDEKALVKKQGRPLIGQLYGYLQLPVLALRRLFSLSLRNFSRQGLVCCHVLGYAYQGVDSPLKDIDPESFDTEELFDMLIDAGWITIFEKEGKK